MKSTPPATRPAPAGNRPRPDQVGNPLQRSPAIRRPALGRDDLAGWAPTRVGAPKAVQVHTHGDEKPAWPARLTANQPSPLADRTPPWNPDAQLRLQQSQSNKTPAWMDPVSADLFKMLSGAEPSSEVGGGSHFTETRPKTIRDLEGD